MRLKLIIKNQIGKEQLTIKNYKDNYEINLLKLLSNNYLNDKKVTCK